MIYIGSDHAGYEMKTALKAFLDGQKNEYVDLGVFSTDSADYPDIAREVSEKVSENSGAFGILICGTGTGMSMAANKLPGIRAAVATSEVMAEMARQHNDANILTLGGRLTDQALAEKMVKIFLETPFDGGERHVRRIQKMSDMDSRKA